MPRTNWLYGLTRYPVSVGLLTVGIALQLLTGLLPLSMVFFCAGVMGLVLRVPTHAPDEAWCFAPNELEALVAVDSIDVDAALLFTGRHMVAVSAAPDRLESRPMLHPGGSALLLAMAVALTDAPASVLDREAVLRAVAALGVVPEQMKRRYPLLSAWSEGDLQGVIVRDGQSRRLFCAGTSSAVLARCTQVMNRRPQPLSEGVRQECARGVADVVAHGAHVTAWAMADYDGDAVGDMTYLGMLGTAREMNDEAVAALHRLQGLSLYVGCDLPEDMVCLMPNGELPDVPKAAEDGRALRVSAHVDEGTAYALTAVHGETTGWAEVLTQRICAFRSRVSLLLRMQAFILAAAVVIELFLKPTDMWLPALLPLFVFEGVARCEAMRGVKPWRLWGYAGISFALLLLLALLPEGGKPCAYAIYVVATIACAMLCLHLDLGEIDVRRYGMMGAAGLCALGLAGFDTMMWALLGAVAVLGMTSGFALWQKKGKCS